MTFAFFSTMVAESPASSPLPECGATLERRLRLDIDLMLRPADAAAVVANDDPEAHGSADARCDPRIVGENVAVALTAPGAIVIEAAVGREPRHANRLVPRYEPPLHRVELHVRLGSGAALPHRAVVGAPRNLR